VTYRLTVPVYNNQIIVNLPANFNDKKQVTVIVDDQIDTVNQKMDLMKLAAVDPLFLSDVEDVEKDFGFSDSEI
jgi:hypothetical protein